MCRLVRMELYNDRKRRSGRSQLDPRRYMNYLIKNVAIVFLLTGVGSAAAEIGLHAGGEYFSWKEAVFPRVKETGSRWMLGVDWLQDQPSGFRAGYKFKYYRGNVDYQGSLLFTGAPITGTTRYRGFVNEVQGLFRMPNSSFEYVSGIGWDHWNRRLNANQDEDFDIGYLRLGANFRPPERTGFFGSAGVKYPFYARENAHLDTVFDQNPKLSLGKQVSMYSEVGYRLTQRLDLIAYYDGWYFRQSDPAYVTLRGAAARTVFQPNSRMDVLGIKLQYSFW